MTRIADIERLDDKFIELYQEIEKILTELKNFLKKYEDRKEYLVKTIDQRMDKFWSKIHTQYHLSDAKTLQIDPNTYQIFEIGRNFKVQVVGRISDDFIAEFKEIMKLIAELADMPRTIKNYSKSFMKMAEVMRKLFWTEIQNHYHLSGNLYLDDTTFAVYQKMKTIKSHRQCDKCPKKMNVHHLFNLLLEIIPLFTLMKKMANVK